MFTKNSNLPHGHGELQFNKFEPFPKNPLISKVFREIGYADELGSGMCNTSKYTKLYFGGIPVFVEDNLFEIVIPMGNVAKLQVGPEELNKKTIDKILETRPKISVSEIAKMLEMSVGGVRYHINKMKRTGLIEHIGSTKKGK